MSQEHRRRQMRPAFAPSLEPADLAVAECHESQSEDSYVQRREKLRRLNATIIG